MPFLIARGPLIGTRLPTSFKFLSDRCCVSLFWIRGHHKPLQRIVCRIQPSMYNSHAASLHVYGQCGLGPVLPLPCYEASCCDHITGPRCVGCIRASLSPSSPHPPVGSVAWKPRRVCPPMSSICGVGSPGLLRNCIYPIGSPIG